MQLTRELTPEERVQALLALQTQYTDFRDFLTDVFESTVPGAPIPTDMQYDMAHYLQSGGHDVMLQAQRGEAKTTITSAFAIWNLIHMPRCRVVIFSAGGKMAKKIATGIIQIIYTMDILTCLRPDRGGEVPQRKSTESFDVHWSLKGTDKQESITCMGVTASMEGNRADLLIADDIESKKNSLSENQRDSLEFLIKDFASIVGSGRTVYLGTPQTSESIYNGLASQGFNIRIWTGRYPTAAQVDNYGPYLAPMISEALKANPELGTGGGIMGDQGQPTDPHMKDEETLQRIEAKQGQAFFQLQHMLNTALSDAERFPLKTTNIMVMNLDQMSVPKQVVWGPAPENIVPIGQGINIPEKFYRPAHISDSYTPFQSKIMAIDPAGGGQNGDESGYAVLGYANGYIFALDIGGVVGGVDEEKLTPLADVAMRWNVNAVVVEKNMSQGAWAYIFEGVLKKVGHGVKVDEVWSSGQKELRIIKALEPLSGAHKLIVNEAILKSDLSSIKKYDVGCRTSYSFLWQWARLTRDKRALRHDDRLDALAIGVDYLREYISANAEEYLAIDARNEYKEYLKNPLGLPDYILKSYDPSYKASGTPQRGCLGNSLDRMRRR